MNMIEIHHLTRDYGEGRGVFDVSFAIEKGEVFGFLGPNGAGKTTTIRHLLGFLQAKQGSCTIDALDCWKDASKIQKQLGYLSGEINLMNDMRGDEFLKFLANYRGMKDMGRTKELCQRFDFQPNGKIKRMSKGMKQKLGIVAAFMHDPQVLILDEPTSGLDPLMQNAFINLIQAEKKRGKTILMSSHMFEEVEKTCDRIAILANGHLAAIEDRSAIQAQRHKTYIVSFADAASAKAFMNEPFAMRQVQDTCIHVRIKKNLQPFLKTLGSYPISDLNIAEQSLEEIFLQYYGEGEPYHE